MNDKDRTTAPKHTAETPSPSQARPGEGAPAPAGDPHHGGEDGTRALDSNGAAELQGDLDTPFGAHSELVKVAAERDEYLALAQRTQADFENYRKRVAREAAGAQERGVAGLAKELLPALDNLDRAIRAADANDPLLKGVRLVRAELAAALARVGIESFRPEGERFDPSLHEAVATAPAGEGGASGSVLEVYQDGYRLGESILRPARVVVSA
jgi:molecular chaperone GrpE